MKNNKLTLVIKSPCISTLKIYIDYLVYNLNSLNLKTTRFFLPKKSKKITLLRSPHVFKKSKEQFKFTFFKVLMQIESLSSVMLNKKVVNILLNRPKSIVIKIKS